MATGVTGVARVTGVTGVILAGGSNRRMGGRPKALLPFPHQSIIRLQLEQMSSICNEIMVVSNPSDTVIAGEVGSAATIVHDLYPGLGPLGGLLTAMEACNNSAIWLVACDMPYISVDAARLMLDRLVQEAVQAVVPVTAESGMVHPLHAIYSTDCRDTAARLVKEQRLSMMELLTSVRRVELSEQQFAQEGMDIRFVTNINTPREYEKELPSMNSTSRFHRDTLSVAEAQTKLAPFIHTTEAERVTLQESFGRATAKPVVSPRPMPHFRRSGVDGYALRSADTSSTTPDRPIQLLISDEIICGDAPTIVLEPGCAVRIMTGAVVPDGADAVIMLEMTETVHTDAQPTVLVKKRMNRGDNVTEVGQEYSSGTSLLPAGAPIHPGAVALIAACGFHEVVVFRKPRIGIMSTGSELTDIHEPLQPGKIYNSNSYLLAALVKEAGGEPFLLPNIPDEVDSALSAVEQALDAYDLVVTTGGVSVGDRDVMAQLFNRWGGTLLFNKVAMRPGSPTSAGVHNGKLLLALSGNPSAAFVGYQLFVKPVIRGMLGSATPFPTAAEADLAVDYTKPAPYTRYVRGVIRNEGGRYTAQPCGPDKSSALLSLLDANGLIIIPAGGGGKRQGETVEFYEI